MHHITNPPLHICKTCPPWQKEQNTLAQQQDMKISDLLVHPTQTQGTKELEFLVQSISQHRGNSGAGTSQKGH